MINPLNSFSRKRKTNQVKKEYPKLSADDRFKICEECPHFLKNTKRCAKCGCFLKLKTAVPGFHCPIDKW